MMENISCEIFAEKLSVDKAYEFILDPACGGNCLFVGTVRNINKGEVVKYLDFETYKPMAIKELVKISQKIQEDFSVSKIVIHHREGHVGISDIAVIIAISSMHRDDAFKACRFAIDQLKETVPIWKKEHLEDGSYWVGARP